MKAEHIPNKHLTYEERNFIEIGLNNGRNFAEIAKDLNKDRRTISREIQKHRFRNQVDSTIQRTYVKADMNAKSLTVTKKWSVMKKIFVTN